NSFRYVLKLHEDLPNTDPKEAFDRLASIKVWEIEAFEKEDFLLPQKTKDPFSHYSTCTHKIPYKAGKFKKIMNKVQYDLLELMLVFSKDLPPLKDILYTKFVLSCETTVTDCFIEKLRTSAFAEEIQAHFLRNNGQVFKKKLEDGTVLVISKKGDDLFHLIEENVSVLSIRDVLCYLLFEQKTIYSFKELLFRKRKSLLSMRTYEQVRKKWTSAQIVLLDKFIQGYLLVPDIQRYCAMDPELLAGVKYCMPAYYEKLLASPLNVNRHGESHE
ncbi:MAG: hypothetical protein AAF335_05230, partial [Bacteroidota bacterium]